MILLFVILASVLAAVVQEAFVQALPAPWSGIELPLLLIVAFAMRLRTRDALVSALAAGLTAEALTSLLPGSRLLLALAVAGVTLALTTRVFSHRSLTGTLAITCTAYLLHRGGEVALRYAHATLSGIPAGAPDAAPILWGLALQLGMAFLLAVAGTVGGRAFSRFFFFR